MNINGEWMLDLHMLETWDESRIDFKNQCKWLWVWYKIYIWDVKFMIENLGMVFLPYVYDCLSICIQWIKEWEFGIDSKFGKR